MNQAAYISKLKGALYGMFIGDALAMPVHWYYNTDALMKDYGRITEYRKPHNPHPDSILYRSSYRATAPKAEILHGQSVYWGKRNIHYHQFLQAGENTLNLKLAAELLKYLQETDTYSAEDWLERLVFFMTTPGTHQDTYIEEYLRHFFSEYGKGTPLLQCGRKDEKHIGGFTQMLPILFAFADNEECALHASLNHLALTHGGKKMYDWGSYIGMILLKILRGSSLRDTIISAATSAPSGLIVQQLLDLQDYPDQIVVGRHFSSACYVEQAIPATVYLALKYQDSPENGLIANTMCGGDNAGRGAVLGALLGAHNGMEGWPKRWIEGLLHPPQLVQISKSTTLKKENHEKTTGLF